MSFLKIFSTPSKRQEKLIEEKIKIIIDNREKNSLVPSQLASFGFQIEFQNLPVADYIINNIAIERKTLSDLKSSIINKRIISQLEELKQYPSRLLIIEGIAEENIYEGIIHENALRGFLLSVVLNYQVPIIFTQNAEDTARYLAVLAKKQPHVSAIRASKIALSRNEQIQYILEGFPHIGPIKAKKLIKKFHSIKNIITAKEEELKEILGSRVSNFKKLIE